MNIGEIKNALKNADPTAQVFYNFTNCYPTKVDSWRGIYADPAIGWRSSEDWRAGENIPTVRDFLQELDAAIEPGREYTGWKGGQYSYDENSQLHVDNPGRYTCTEIIRVDISGLRVTLITDIIE